MIIHTPAQVGQIGINYLDQIAHSRDRLAPILMPGLDAYFGPLLPGELCVVQAQTHHGKSLFMRSWANRIASYYASRGRPDVIPWIDTETPIDHLAMNQLASLSGSNMPEVVYGGRTIDLVALTRAATEIAKTPVFPIATRVGDGREDEIHLSNIQNALRLLMTGKVDGVEHQIGAVFIDYLQALPYDPTVRKQRDIEGQRRLQVSRDVEVSRRTGSMCNAPVILGVQAKQTLDVRSGDLPIPGMYDGQETANIAQRADRIISLFMPGKRYPKGTPIEFANERFIVTPGLMFVRVLKQRLLGLPSGATFAYEIQWGAKSEKERFSLLWAEDHGFDLPGSANRMIW